MHIASIASAVLLALVVSLASPQVVPDGVREERLRILLLTKTEGFRHDSIPAGIDAIVQLSARHGFDVLATEDAAIFTDEELARFSVIIFLNTTGTILDKDQKLAFQGFVRAGGGFVGIHAAADTEHDWPWYQDLIVAHFKSHPAVQPAEVMIDDPDHISTRHLREIGSTPLRWKRTDEWYDFKRSPRGRAHILLSLDESTYTGGAMGDDHPIAWCHDFDGGRVWYTGLGHTKESYQEPAFLEHLLGGIRWAADRPAREP